uniref:solute carrier family 35 member E4 isoform X2 n=1 Tax=Pristiophorus japonicus TaxID=55135 RepID=UPI00398E71D1
MTTADVFPEFPPPISEKAAGAIQKKRQMLHTLAAVVVLLATGTTITSLNKCIFAVYNFRYPLLLSALHMLTAIVVDYALIRMGFVNLQIKEVTGLSAAAKFKVFLLSLTFCATIAFGNMGLNCVQLSFAQMISTTTPLFTIAISKLYLGILLQEEKINSVILLYMMSIPSFCILISAALLLESGAVWEPSIKYDNRLWIFILLSCLGSVLYNLASFCVTTLTSAVTLHVVGNLNMVGNLVISQVVFGSEMTALSYAGIGLTLTGVLMYQNSDLIADYLNSRSKYHEEQDKLKTD